MNGACLTTVASDVSRRKGWLSEKALAGAVQNGDVGMMDDGRQSAGVKMGLFHQTHHSNTPILRRSYAGIANCL
jgi:hypothetical protein